MTPALVGLREIRQAAKRVEDVATRTPLLPSPELSAETGAEVRLKCESLQRAGSFKIRGAYNYVSHLSDDELARGIITYSSGNHAQAVALAAQIKGIRAVVVMPTDAPDVKRRGAEHLGAEVVFEGTTSLERKARAEAIAEAEGLHVVPPFDHPYIIAGQGTTGLEIMAQWPEADTIFVPIGGGGLVSGVAAAVRELNPEARIYGVEPRGAAAMRAALDAGHPVTLDSTDTIADGLRPVRSGDLTFEHVRELVDDVIVVEDAQIRSAASLLLAKAKLVVEFSGAATVAAVRSGAVPLAGRHVVAVLSGGNLDPLVLGELARGEPDSAV